ncbi:FHA domain-containing protein [Nocardia brasiliensis]|uniref:FHA domain-containing protein n=1 Tax=Nocardia brasiliensis TaxID=37326 RepID=UPI00366C8A76
MSRQIEVLPGRHLVAGTEGVVVVVAHRLDTAVTADSVAARAMTALLGIVRQAASNEPRRSGRTLARLATNWLMGLENGDEDAVEFGVITPGDTGIAVFLHGAVTAVLAGPRGSEILRGRDAGFTVDRVVTPAPGIGAGLFVDEPGREVEKLPERGFFALTEGTAPGSGAVLWFGAGGASMPAAEPVPQRASPPRPGPDLRKRDESMDAPTESYSGPAVPRTAPQEPVAQDVRAAAAEPPRSGNGPSHASGTGPSHGPARPDLSKRSAAPEGDPVRGFVGDVDLVETVVPAETLVSRVPDSATVRESASPGVIVKGFKCARDHLNDPRVSFCAVCGIRMDQLTCVLTDGVRPPLGLLLLDDGTSFVLDNDCVLGREPEHAEAVARGARPVRLEDRSGGMSRAHAEIRLIDWDVTVVDGGSTNGTHIRQPGHPDWTRAIPGHPVKLVPGAQVQLGGRVVTFDSQHGQL